MKIDNIDERIWVVIEWQHWNNFVSSTLGDVVLLVVDEFYANVIQPKRKRVFVQVFGYHVMGPLSMPIIRR